MPITPGDGEYWKVYTRKLKKSMDYIAEHGTRGLTVEQLKDLGRPIIRAAQKRLRDLVKEGYTDSPAYSYITRENINLSMAGNNAQHLKYVLREAYDFLLHKTSTVKGTEEFIESTIERFTQAKLNKDEREAVWDFHKRLQSEHPGYFQVNYTSDQLNEDIYDWYTVLSKNDFDVDRAFDWITQDVYEFLKQEGVSKEEIRIITKFSDKM